MLYPLKFKPILKETVWGGKRLANKGNIQNPDATIGESWEISGVQDNLSVVSEGALADNTLEELIGVYMGDLVAVLFGGHRGNLRRHLRSRKD